MKTIALRFSENFSPPIGTIAAHQQLIDSKGYVWYGKLGTPISAKVADEIMQNEDPKILLISSGKQDRYWAHITDVSRSLPPIKDIPEYYGYMSDKFKCWFKVKSFEIAPKGIMAECHIASSKVVLSQTSKHSMSPYFIIIYEEKTS